MVRGVGTVSDKLVAVAGVVGMLLGWWDVDGMVGMLMGWWGC